MQTKKSTKTALAKKAAAKKADRKAAPAKPPKVYETTWRNKFLTLDAKSIDEMVAGLEGAVAILKEMGDAGVTLDDDGGVADDYARLVTTDREVAQRFDFEEVECFDEDEEFDDCGDNE